MVILNSITRTCGSFPSISWTLSYLPTVFESSTKNAVYRKSSALICGSSYSYRSRLFGSYGLKTAWLDGDNLLNS